MKATFENTISVLVKAYMNGTLQHANCNACAVGNLVANAMNYEYYVKTDGCYPDNFLGWKGSVTPEWFNSLMVFRDPDNKQIQSTGYTFKELIRIEGAFEFRFTPFSQKPEDPDGYKGLMAVVDQLAIIHNVDLSVRENAKLMFVKS